MEITTLSRQFLPIEVIDVYDSVIWTERYYGDSEVQLVVPAKVENLDKLPKGQFLTEADTDEVMMVETHDIADGVAKITCTSLLKWFNNRVIRASVAHEDRYWDLTDMAPGVMLWHILNTMCVEPNEYPLGMHDASKYKVSNISADLIDTTGPNITAAVPYGPVYDAMYTIATTNKVGMTLTLDEASDAGYSLKFRSYRGLNYTSEQTANPIVRFSPDMDSLTDIKEIQSIASHKTEMFAYAPANPGELAIGPGFAGPDMVYIPEEPPVVQEFDLRVGMMYADDITTETPGLATTLDLIIMLSTRAREALETTYKYIKLVDGEIVPTSQFEYGKDYNLGDVIEIQGYSGITQAARVVEHIRSQDSSGTKSYPSLEMID